MTLQRRLMATIVLLMVFAVGLSWLIVHLTVFRPFANEVQRGWVRELVVLAKRIDRGADPAELAEDLGVQLEPVPRDIPPGWQKRRIRGVELYERPGRQSLVIQTRLGPYAVRRDLDLNRPRWVLLAVLGAIGLGIVLLAGGLARRATRPLEDATRAMTRMSKGDLDLRLEEQGPAEIVAASKAFNHLAARIRELLGTERMLLAGISHELRTPLTRLRLETELLRDAGVDPKRLDRMDDDLAQLDALLGEALDLSRMQLGARPLTLQSTELLPWMTDRLGDRITVRGASPTLPLDHFLLGRAVDNLVQNAHKYAPGTPITVVVYDDGFAVQDGGPGLPERELERVFEPFHRTAEGSRQAEGHGLGLMLVKTIAQLHGGGVEASNLHPGLEIRLRLG